MMNLGSIDANGLMFGKKQPPALSYSIFDTFSIDRAAGAIDGTLATDGRSIRHVYDPLLHLSISAGSLTKTGSEAAGATDFKPGFWYDGVSRSHILIAQVRPGARGPDYVGFHLSPETVNAGPWGNEYSIRFVNNGVYAGILTGSSAKLGDTVAGTTYTAAVIALPDFGGQVWIKGGAWATWTLLHTDATAGNNHAILFPTVSHYIDAVVSTDYIDWIKVLPYFGSSPEYYENTGGEGRVTHYVTLFGDSKSTSLLTPGLMNTEKVAFIEVPTARTSLGATPNRMATGGATVASRTGTIVADLAAITTGTPEYILWNLGTNDVLAMPAEGAFKANCQTDINAMRGKWAAVKILFMRVWHRGQAANCNSLNSWYADMVTANPGICYLGPDERIFLEGGDNGVSMTVDGIHPTVPYGYLIENLQWRFSLGF